MRFRLSWPWLIWIILALSLIAFILQEIFPFILINRRENIIDDIQYVTAVRVETEKKNEDMTALVAQLKAQTEDPFLAGKSDRWYDLATKINGLQKKTLGELRMIGTLASEDASISRQQIRISGTDDWAMQTDLTSQRTRFILNNYYSDLSALVRESGEHNFQVVIPQYLSNRSPVRTLGYFAADAAGLQASIETIAKDVQISALQQIEHAAAMTGTVAVHYDKLEPQIAFDDSVYTAGAPVHLLISFVETNTTVVMVKVNETKLQKNPDGTYPYTTTAGKPGVHMINIKYGYLNEGGQPINVVLQTTYIVGTKGIKPAGPHPVIKEKPQTNRSGKQTRTTTLVYGYPVNIRRGQSKSVNALLAVNRPTTQLIEYIKAKVIREQNVIDAGDTTHIFTEEMRYCKKVTLTLLDPEHRFIITKVNEDSQTLDANQGNKWRWNVVTETDKPTARLILKITAEGPHEELEEKDILINVEIGDSNFLRRTWIFFTDNIEKAWVLLLIPVFAFVRNKIWGRKEKPNGK